MSFVKFSLYFPKIHSFFLKNLLYSILSNRAEVDWLIDNKCGNALNQLIVIKTERSFFMALDGIVISNIVEELNQTILNGRISKIAQPEPDELLLTIKNNKTQYKFI